MADTRVGWEGELGRWLRPFLERLSHKASAADQGQGSATSAGGQGLAHRRTPRIRREEILSPQPPRRDEPAHSGCHHQGTMDLRTGPPADERRTRPRPLRGPILARPSPTRAHDNDRLRLPSASSPHPSEAGKKESTDRHLSQPCPPCVTPSSTSSCDHCSDARTVEYASAARGLKTICQSSARARHQISGKGAGARKQ